MRHEARLLPEGADVPNHPRWPVIVYPGAVDPAAGDAAAAFEARFAANGWGDGWRNGIFAFHHFHPNAHEVLGIARGHARVQLGGEGGEVFEVAAGDALLLPAGTGHKRLAASPDLLVIGAYPPGPSAELRRGGEGSVAGHLARIKAVGKPGTDPLGGSDGPMVKLWR